MIKPVTPGATVAYVSCYDPAVDWEAIIDATIEKNKDLGKVKDANDRRARARTVFVAEYMAAAVRNPAAWREMLKFKNGESPTEFTLGALSSDDAVRMADECGASSGKLKPQELQWRAFLGACRDIRNWPTDVPKVRKGEIEIVDASWLRNNFVLGLRAIALDVGSVAWMWNQFSEDDIKN